MDFSSIWNWLCDFFSNPIVWNWIVGAVVVVLALRCVVLHARCEELQYAKNDESLKNQIFPHTIRNKIEKFRIETKHLKKQTDALYEEINSVSDFLGDEAYSKSNSEERTLTPISDEIEMMKKYIQTSCGGDSSNVEIRENIENYDFELPDRITVSMIENAFKHGDTSAPDFMKIDITEKENGNYEIVVRNKIKPEDVSKDGKLSGLGIQNMKDRIANYNEYSYEYEGKILKTSRNGYFYFKLLFKKI